MEEERQQEQERRTKEGRWKHEKGSGIREQDADERTKGENMTRRGNFAWPEQV